MVGSLLMQQTQQRQYRILVVDDNEDLLLSVKFALQAWGNYIVETALNGEDGLDRAAGLPRPDCVVVDVKMPGLNGNQLVRILRGDPQTADIPLIILSALVQEEDILRGQIAGVDQYLTKPFDVEALVAAIERAVRLTSTERAARLRVLLDDFE